MIQIPAHIQTRYKTLLIKKAIPQRYHYDYITLILRELEAFICKAFKGEAIVCYCEPLIIPPTAGQMEASGSPER